MTRILYTCRICLLKAKTLRDGICSSCGLRTLTCAVQREPPKQFQFGFQTDEQVAKESPLWERMRRCEALVERTDGTRQQCRILCPRTSKFCLYHLRHKNRR